MDPAAKKFEGAVNAAFRLPFRFHRISKLCICLGPSVHPRPEYLERLGVADKHYPDFSYAGYVAQSDEDRTKALDAITREVFLWMIQHFEDANFVLVAAKNLGWDGFPEPVRPVHVAVQANNVA